MSDEPVVHGPATVLHVDMDAFFVSVELLRRPELRGQPVIVGGGGRRGVVAAASYEARAYGIHSAMPSAQARRLCPNATFLPGDHHEYSDVSGRVMELFRAVTPLVEPVSLDEAFLDVAGARRLLGPPVSIAHRLRADVRRREGLHCSVGVAPNKFLAKLASEHAKPAASRSGPVEGEGVHVVDPDGVQAFLDPLPVRAIWGVGPATRAKLERLGIGTVAELAAVEEASLVTALGEAHGRHLARLARGIDGRRVTPNQAAKSISHEETYPHDLHEHERITSEIVRMADAVSARLRRSDLKARTVTLKVRFSSFDTITRSVTLPSATDVGATLSGAARGLWASVEVSQGIRLLGVGVSGLTDAAVEQLTFDSLTEAAWRDADTAVDDIRGRYGADSIGMVSSLRGGGLRPKRRGDQQWGPDD